MDEWNSTQQEPQADTGANDGRFSQQTAQTEERQDFYQNNTEQASSYQQAAPAKEPQKTNALAVIGLILGILSILLGCCAWYGLIAGIPGIICSVLAKKEEKSSLATAGLVCSIIGTALAVIMTILGAVLLGILQTAGFTYGGIFDDILREYY